MYVQSFKDLFVWQRAIEVVREIYVITKELPGHEAFGLTSQMRRAAVSIPANVAEGKKRRTRKDFLMFLRIVDGSAAELETLIIIAKDAYPKTNFAQAGLLLSEVQKMLITIIKHLNPSNS